MTESTQDARASVGLVLGASCAVGLLSAGAAALAHAIARWPAGADTMALGRPSVFVLALASGFFLASGVMRLSRWQVSREARSAFAGAALMVVGGLYLPLSGFAVLLPGGHEFSLVGPATRTVAELIAIALLLRALTVTEVSPAERPGRLLPQVFAFVLLVFAVLLGVQQVVPATVAFPALVLSVVRPVAWFAVAMLAASRSRTLPWAGRVAPLLVGMGLAESLRGLDRGSVGPWTFAGLLLCTVMAALSARSALLDLDEAVRVTERSRTDLTRTLTQVSDEAVELTEWREQLTHDARNACAGLRAALGILERYDGHLDVSTREKLRLAAVQELGHIEHLLTRAPDEPCAPFEVGEVVRRVADAARAVGADISVQGLPVHGVGRPGDLAAVLKNLLVNAQTHAPGSEVRLRLHSDGETVRVTCSDDGPGLRAEDAPHVFERGFRGPASQGSGLGLHAARELMREQGGELDLASPGAGATFVVTLPRAAAVVRHRHPVRVPAQRPSYAGPTGLDQDLRQPVA